MSGTKRLLEMSDRINHLWSEGNSEPEIVTVIADEFSVKEYLAEAIVTSWSEGRIAKNFSYDGGESYGG